MKSIFLLLALSFALVQANPNCLFQYEQLGRCYSTLLMQRTERVPPISLCDFLTKALQCVDVLRLCVSQKDLDNERDSLFGVMIHNPDVIKFDDPNRCPMVRNGKRMTFTSLCSFEEAKLPHQRTKQCLANVLEKFFRTHRHTLLGLSDSHQCDLLKDAWGCIDSFLQECASTEKERISYRNSNLKSFIETVRNQGYDLNPRNLKNCHLLV